MNQQQARALSDITSGNLFDADWEGGQWMARAVETHETIEQFIQSSKSWKESTAAVRGTIAGMPCVTWKQMQAVAGQQRDSLTVIDFGDVRMAVNMCVREWMV